ncbi:hypothetical protein HK101_007190 [Irineochytrium annulatum]|nr:hypothetical protein HK101_007190 [Irineochytrium annulatum]
MPEHSVKKARVVAELASDAVPVTTSTEPLDGDSERTRKTPAKAAKDGKAGAAAPKKDGGDPQNGIMTAFAKGLTVDFFTTNDKPYSSEVDVGITAFVDDKIPGFTGIIKQRYSDFLVNEVDFKGQVLHLEETELREEVPLTLAKDPEAVRKEMLELLEDADLVAKVLDMAGKPDGDLEEVIQTQVFSDRKRRGDIHRFFRKHYDKIIISDAADDLSIKLRRANDKDKEKKKGRIAKEKVDWKAVGGQFLEFILYKENRDTMDVLNHLAKVVGVPGKNFTFAGTKDKRGVTVQRVTGREVPMKALAAAGASVYNARLGNYKYTTERARLGDLLGNHFKITLRSCTLADPKTKLSLEKILERSMLSLRDKGFINYYGMQRFGTRSIPTHAPGIAMMCERWDIAVELVMMPKGQEKEDVTKARQDWFKRKDAKSALKLFPKYCAAERAILQAKARKADDRAAMLAIPRNLRMMYVHAVQSFIWNNMASERIKRHGLRVVVGDLVAKATGASPPADDAAEDDAEDYGGDSVEESRLEKVVEVEVIETEEQAAALGIEDVVLPLPGYNVTYPRNDIGQCYVDFMKKYGLDAQDMRRKHREISLTGDYRKLINKVSNVAWKVLKYTDPTVPLTLTDVDVLEGKSEPVSDPKGEHTACICEFTLGSSAYATMALREVLKTDTSSHFQAGLTNANAAKDDPMDE